MKCKNYLGTEKYFTQLKQLQCDLLNSLKYKYLKSHNTAHVLMQLNYKFSFFLVNRLVWFDAKNYK